MIPYRKIDHWEFISNDEKLSILPNYFSKAYFPISNISLVKIYNKYFYFHTDGYIISQFSFDKEASSFSCDRALVKYQNKFGYIDIDGNIVIPIVFEKANRFSENLASVRINGKWGFIDQDGNLVIKHKYDEVRGFLNGFCAIKRENKWGMITPEDELLIEPKFEELGNFHEGLAFIKENGKYGYINEQCEIVISPVYKKVENFSTGFCIVYEDFKRIYLDKNGMNYKFPDYLKGFTIYSFFNGYAWFKKESEWGVINEHFEVILKPKYKDYFPNNFNKEGFCLISRRFDCHHEYGTDEIIEDIGYIDSKGNEYWEDSTDPDYYIRKAKDREANSPEEALFQYQTGYDKDKTRHDILCEMGKVYLGLREYDMAIDFFSKTIDIAPTNFEYILLRGNSYSLKGDYNRALVDYDNCKVLKDDDSDLYVNIWHAKFKMEDPSAYYDILRAKELGYKKADEIIQKYYQ